ncbi:uncharacterized protein LOC131982933 [Centropristis striata]|uniref:uncharacterized protein LOC131982933 n=1 Tax=Centropristis striata TaxID=184440 RepID=UPI0027E1D547|nr:uncharacterized protein LOC131982933 [Centropristis striata]
MSAVFKLLTLLCLFCTALSEESSGVEWRDAGGDVTVQCRPPKKDKDQEYLTLMKGLSEDHQVFLIDGKTAKKTVADEFTTRLQTNGVFPNVDILIRNLTSQDTGPFWCYYKKFDKKVFEQLSTKGEGSVLLVVTDTRCDPSNNNHILLAVVISGSVLLAVILCIIIGIICIKTKASRTTKKQRRVPTNDVYEDMRGTIRR